MTCYYTVVFLHNILAPPHCFYTQQTERLLCLNRTETFFFLTMKTYENNFPMKTSSYLNFPVGMTGYHAISKFHILEKKDSQLLLLLIFSHSYQQGSFLPGFLCTLKKLHYILCNITSFLGSSCHTKHKMLPPLSYHQRSFVNLPTS